MGLAPRTYTLRSGDAGVLVTATVPPEWTETIEPTCVRFGVPSAGGRGPGLTLVRAWGDDERTRLAWVLSQQFGSDLPAASQLDRGGRLWVVHRRPTGHVHARVYVPAEAIGGFLVGAISLGPSQSAHLAEMEPVLDTVRVA
ncbi:MAG TPA: hypothetical protein VL463_14515 [Kofleriaceae bacterium]|nr:hypothetical protein [Kofleriaceae bacterium]